MVFNQGVLAVNASIIGGWGCSAVFQLFFLFEHVADGINQSLDE